MALRYTTILVCFLTFSQHAFSQASSVEPHKVEDSLKKLADQGNSKAMLDLALGYLVGKYALDRDPEEALYWLTRAAAQDKKSIRDKVKPHPRALLYLGFCYDDSIHAEFLKIKPNYETALKYYKLAEDHGFTEASQHVAYTYRKLGKPKKAAEYFKKAADQKIPRSQVEYAKILLAGTVVKKDPAAALGYLEQASTKGSTEAMLLLADLYGGKYPQVKPNQTKMIDALWQAAATESRAMTRIGYCYQHGISFPIDPHLAAKWYMKAATAPVPDPIAFLSLGKCHSQGIGVPQNDRTALKYYLRAAAEPEAPALAPYNAGMCFLVGKGTKADPKQGFNYMKMAADQDYPKAISTLAGLYEDGKAFDNKEKALPPQPKRALELYEEAAKLDDLAAIMKLGIAYLKGEMGLAVDKEKALRLLYRASVLGKGEKSSAWKVLKKLLQDNPKLVPVLKSLETGVEKAPKTEAVPEPVVDPAEPVEPVEKAKETPKKDYPGQGMF